ncbi:MAG: SDR family NAD(P)-dependent oxidoreductase [Deltaproteobacteria bacterium]|nr:SDR family NAD(P)-dependent oxidoreductase [Deltaproteobacteria bacterium]
MQTILAIVPFNSTAFRFINEISRAGGLGILDLSFSPSLDGVDFNRLDENGVEYGVLVRSADSHRVPQACRLVVIVEPGPIEAVRARKRAVFAQVRSLEEALQAVAFGVDGLIAKGSESASLVGEQTSFVLLQRILSEVSTPIWSQGGIGPHTAAAAIAGGASGVVLDSQLALLPGSPWPSTIRSIIKAMDGSETTIIGGYRVFNRPDLELPPSDTPRDRIPSLLGTDPQKGPVTIGQDAVFAKSFLHRFSGAAELVRGITRAVRSNIRQAKRLDPLGPDNAFARYYHIQYPIIQGPMSKVSDRPAFALAVSKAGGLPFIALSLLAGREAQRLLSETAKLLEGRAWGVGMLGFVPRALHEQQLAALRENPPSTVLIAGGRPSQVHEIEKMGINCFVHIPSLGLLDIFIKDGARKFIFEGRECGGHVGPLTSFVLWQSAIDRLLQRDDIEDFHLIFAGGIHDARSAAMLSAMISPLSVRGAKIGVMMGTAYLFTREAVSSGAISPTFQQVALECTKTRLIETAPGHATRAADTRFVQTFQSEKKRLNAEEIPPQDRWMALEDLNLGRLHIATRGFRREGGKQVKVSAFDQLQQGLYMIGQIAALRKKTLTIAELHRNVSCEYQRRLNAITSPPLPLADTGPADIAIIGMAGVFPGAADIDDFWHNIVLGLNSIQEVTKDRWNLDIYYDPRADNQTAKSNKIPSKWGGFIPELRFDPQEFGIPPVSLSSIDPTQLVSLIVVKQALVDASIDLNALNGERVSVFFGAESSVDFSYGFCMRAYHPQVLGNIPPELDSRLPLFSEDTFPGVLVNVISGRVSNRLDFSGTNYTVNAACASSLASIDAACKELCLGTSDLAIAGGADLHNSIYDYMLFNSSHSLSPSGQCRTFDAKADGIVLGEGVGVLVLKRLADARRDDDSIYAVIKSIAGSSDGRSLGLTAPRREGQWRALERAYDRARIDPGDVELFEAHGTGTVVGDRTELSTLSDFVLDAGGSVACCTLGSVKSQIGHTKCAGGIAGLIKAVLSIHHAVLPPTLNLDTPTKYYKSYRSPFVFRKRSVPWLSDRRLAGVNAFGFGGSNFHVVLENRQGQQPTDLGLSRWPSELFIFRGASREQALVPIRSLMSYIERVRNAKLRDLAYTVAKTTSHEQPVQVAFVVDSVDDLRQTLAAVQEGVEAAGIYWADRSPSGEVAFLYPGQGSQRIGMLADLAVIFPELRALLFSNLDLVRTMMPPKAFDPESSLAQRQALDHTRVAQPALGLMHRAMDELLSRLGIEPDMTAGHSYGELSALVKAGAIARDQLIDLSRSRAEAILSRAGEDPGTMAAVAAARQAVEPHLTDLPVVVANINHPQQVVISGPTDAVSVARQRLNSAGLTNRSVAVACAFHSPLIAQADREFLRVLDRTRVKSPSLPVWSNATSAPYENSPQAVRRLLCEQLVKPVDFVRLIRSMYDAGARVFVEIGPGGILTGFVHKILLDRPHQAFTLDDPRRHGLKSLLEGLAVLAAAGVRIDQSLLYQKRNLQLVDLENPKPESSFTSWTVNGHYARPSVENGSATFIKPITEPIVTPSTAASLPAESDPQKTLIAYFNSMRDLAEGQHRVMLSYLEEKSAQPIVSASLPAIASVVADGIAEPSRVDSDNQSLELSKQRATARSPDLDPRVLLVKIVSERTGYPSDMLELDLDLEADLGIDSIKRIEIVATLNERLRLWALSADQLEVVLLEELASLKTLRRLGDFLERTIREKEKSGEAEPVKPEASFKTEASVAEIESVAATSISRLVPSRVTLDDALEAPNTVPAGRYLVVLDNRGIGDELIAILHSRGVDVASQAYDALDFEDPLDTLIDLEPLVPDIIDPAKSVFNRVKKAAAIGVRTVLMATGSDGQSDNHGAVRPALGAGVAGVIKSAGRELPGLRFKVVQLDLEESAGQAADHLLKELLREDTVIQAGYQQGSRYGIRFLPSPRSSASNFSLESGAVVLATGGARGITARMVRELARRFPCHFEIVGRSPVPESEEEPKLASCVDKKTLRQAFINEYQDQGLPLCEIEKNCDRVLAAREIRETIATLQKTGSTVCYHSLDVRDTHALGQLIDDIYARHGRLDGVIHGAGVVDDKRLGEKTRESFDLVYDTKVKSARTILEKLREYPRFFVFLSSISAVYGNAGQSDYAAANDYLNQLAQAISRFGTTRALSINWGPWAGIGMVDESLERVYRQRGIELINPREGANAFVDELVYGTDPLVLLVAKSSAQSDGYEQS